MTRLFPLASLLIAVHAVAAPVPKVVLTAEQEKEFNDLWDNRHEAASSSLRLYCRLVSQPDAGAEYLRRLVMPANLSVGEAKQLIADLGSKDEATWKRAFRDLTFRDVRLAMTFHEAWEVTETDSQRGRLAYVVVSPHLRAPTGELTAKYVPPRRPDEGWELHLIKDGRGMFGQRVSQTFDERTKFEKEYDERNPHEVPLVIAALERIDTPAAREHLKALAGGHADARLTRQATAALDRMKIATKKGGAVEEDVWRKRFEKVSRTDTANACLDAPEETVRKFRTYLRPVKLTRDGAKALLAKLLGDDKKEVLAAVRELQVVDLQLEMDFAEMWAEADTPTKRCRLVDAMKLSSDHPYNSIPDDFDIDERNKLMDYKLNQYDRVGEFPCDAGVRSIWRADVLPANRIGDQPSGGQSFGFQSRKGESAEGRWYREVSAIHILDAIGTDDALAIIKDMATGHPDAGPTKAAKEVLKRRGVK